MWEGESHDAGHHDSVGGYRCDVGQGGVVIGFGFEAAPVLTAMTEVGIDWSDIELPAGTTGVGVRGRASNVDLLKPRQRFFFFVRQRSEEDGAHQGHPSCVRHMWIWHKGEVRRSTWDQMGVMWDPQNMFLIASTGCMQVV